MASRKKKPDTRALFKEAKSRKVDSGGSTAASTVGRPTSKYSGKSKEELLALLKARQAAGANAPTPAPTPAVRQALQRKPSPRTPTVKVPIAAPPAAVRPVLPKAGQVAAGSGILTGLLGIGAEHDDSDSSSSSSSNNKSDDNNDDGKPDTTSGGLGATTDSASAIPESLPAGFFDEDVDLAGVSTSGSTDQRGMHDADMRPKEGSKTGAFGPERAAELAAEAAAEAEADALREKERFAKMRAAGVVQAGDKTGAAMEPGAVGDATPFLRPDGDEDGAAPNGSALPEGFFDDPEVDAKSRGVDLKAKKREDEMREWSQFMSFAEEVKKTEKDEEQQEEVVEEEKGQYEELEQATMMGRLAMLMNQSESIERKRRHPAHVHQAEKKEHDEEAETQMGPSSAKRRRDESGGQPPHRGASNDSSVGVDERGGGSGSGMIEQKRDVDEVEMSVSKTGSAMREVAVASAPPDAAAAEISNMLRGRKRTKKKEVESAFAGEYVPMDPLNWRARGR